MLGQKRRQGWCGSRLSCSVTVGDPGSVCTVCGPGGLTAQGDKGYGTSCVRGSHGVGSVRIWAGYDV